MTNLDQASVDAICEKLVSLESEAKDFFGRNPSGKELSILAAICETLLLARKLEKRSGNAAAKMVNDALDLAAPKNVNPNEGSQTL